ncbi:uncharacterized protein MONOS_6489fu6490 [Monocercomonoides exilis]|uniref:uncharacterized protein n=1 Tax=Monocercomonoides exilis TaxID=2049356 RepID=UPI00355A8113|nr:hypothetical protein MONOS_6489fu6490 [Monocercomonoides exilis]
MLNSRRCRRNSCTREDPNGIDVEITDNTNHLRQNPPPFVESFTTCTTQSVYLNYAEGVRYATGWMEPFSLNQFVGNDGQDLIGSVCNDEFSPCRTVQKAISSLHSISLSTITLLEGLISSEPSPLHLNSKTLKITGSSRQNVQLATDLLPADSSLFSISCGTLYALSFSVNQNSTTVPTPTIFQSDSISLLTISNVAIFSSTFNIEELEVSSHVFDVCLKKVEIRDLLICNITTSESLFHHSSSSEAEDSHLSNITVANVTLLTGSGLILSIRTALNEHLKMMNNTIENCSCISGNGGGIAIFLDHESSSLQIGSQSSSTLFTSCHCGGFGGGIYIEMAEGATDFCLSDITFCKCSANNGGNNVFINGSALSSVWLNNGTLNISFEGSSSDDLMCCDRLIPILNPFSLNAFLVPFNAPAHVTGDPSRGLDSSFCGLSFLPCLTIMHTVRALFPTSSPLIVIDDCLQVDEQLIVSQHPWNVSAIKKGLQVSILAPSDFSSSSFVTVTAGASFNNICFGLPSQLQSASFFISCSTSSLLLINCSIVFEVISQGSAVEYGFADIEEGGLEVENFETKNGAVLQSKSFIKCHGLHGFADFKNCRFSGFKNVNGNGGCIYAEWNGGQTGVASELMIDNCNVSECCAEGSAKCGGGAHISLGAGDGLVVNGSSVFEGCCAGKLIEDKGKGGGLMIGIESEESILKLDEGVVFSKVKKNLAWLGKDVFVKCENNILLKDIVNSSTFMFFDGRVTSPEDTMLYGSENGAEDHAIPLFVFFASLSSSAFVDGVEGADHTHCGYELFPCGSVSYCVNNRISNAVGLVEVLSSTSISEEMLISAIPLIFMISQHIEKATITVVEGDKFTQDAFVDCSVACSFSNFSLHLPSAFDSSRRAFLHSTFSLALSSCSILFASSINATGTSVGYCIICAEGGEVELEGFEINQNISFSLSSFMLFEGCHSVRMIDCRILGVEKKEGDGGSLYLGGYESREREGREEVFEVLIEGCTFSSSCTGGDGSRGGGILLEVNKENKVNISGVACERCTVPSGNGTDEGKGLGGGLFLELENGATNFVLEQLRFDRCLAWKGKNIFVNGDHLNEIVNEQHFCWNLSGEELSSLEEICGWERSTTGVEYVIPIVVFLWNNLSGNGFVDGTNGADFSGCGYEVTPCKTVDQIFSAQFPPNSLTSPTSLTLIQSASINNPISFSESSNVPSLTNPSVLMEGLSNNTNVFACSVNGADAATICSTVQLSFSDLKFILPTTSDADTSFVLFSAATSSLSVSHCSFVSNATVSQVAVYPTVLNVVSGGAMLNHVFIAGFSLSGAFLLLGSSVSVVSVEFLSAASINVTGASIISTNSDSSVIIPLSHQGNLGRINSKTAITISCSNFSFITREDEGAGIVSSSGFGEIEFIVNKSNLEKCVSEGSKEGGGAMICLEHEYSRLTVEGCSFVWCASSTVEGRGGGMMINCQNKDETSNSGIREIGLLIKNDVFVVNNAFVGKDIFIQCESIMEQINETLFSLDFNQTALQSNNSICGSDRVLFDVDLMEYIRFFKGEAIFVSEGFEDSRLCGSQTNPCRSISCASSHVEPGFRNCIWINGSAAVVEETALSNLRLGSSLKDDALLNFCESIPFNNESRGIICFSEECVAESCKFLFDIEFACKHPAILEQINGSLLIDSCYFSCQSSVCLNSSLVIVKSGVFVMNEGVINGVQMMIAPLLLFKGSCSAELKNVTFGDLKLANSAIVSSVYSRVIISNAISENTTIANGCFICLSNDGTSSICDKDSLENNKLSDFAKGSLSIFISSFVNITSDGMDGSVVKCESVCDDLQLINCTFSQCFLNAPKGSAVSLNNLKEALIDSCCVFGDLDDEGNKKNEESKRTKIKEENDVCKWNGSVIEIINCSVYVKDSTIANSSKGGVGIEHSSVKLEKDEFMNNDGRIEKFRSARRNVVCQGSGELNVVSLKGGDGWERNTSLWILDEGCTLEGIAKERESPFFIPKVESVSSEKSGEKVDVVFRGSILLPCNLSFKTVAAIGDDEVVEKYSFDANGFISEEEVHGSVPVKTIEDVPSEAEVRVCILFGKVDKPSATDSFILKNRSAIEQSGDEQLVEGGKEGKSWAFIIAVIFIIMFLIVLVVSIILAVRWKKQKRRTEELEIIVEDNIKKDPKAFEMVTMEMSPEEQWRRAEREAEKKNEERIKKRVYETNMVHSESKEYLLSESGSTEYILGKDSDKIPDWALEKEEEEETRKRTPSPSISSTSTTDTSDTDTTFVRTESLCPTTSSMSNLVDAIACSSPHEKLIVDLRDSLFMLLHGRNEKKEMAIDTLQEREVTAAQILFWVANGALHSFDEMENPLSSLENLSPHIVLFSEHMVICIAMHSDCSSSDSDSSSISSSTIVTSSSDGSRRSKRYAHSPPPSSAFEDDEDNRNECLRWKAPELLINMKMGATKASVSFSIGMMLWECLTLEIPFSDYEAEMAGRKISEGQLPSLMKVNGSTYLGVVQSCLSPNPFERCTLIGLKREFIQRFPAGAVMPTVSDALDFEEDTNVDENGSSCTYCSSQ